MFALDVWPRPVGHADVLKKTIDPDFNLCWSIGVPNKSPTPDYIFLYFFKSALPTLLLANFATIEIGLYLDTGSAGGLGGGIQIEHQEVIQLINKQIGI